MMKDHSCYISVGVNLDDCLYLSHSNGKLSRYKNYPNCLKKLPKIPKLLNTNNNNTLRRSGVVFVDQRTHDEHEKEGPDHLVQELSACCGVFVGVRSEYSFILILFQQIPFLNESVCGVI